MTDTNKKTILIVSIAFLLFMVVKPKRKKLNAQSKMSLTDEEDAPKDRTPMKVPTMSSKTAQKNPQAKNAFACLKGYVDAYNNGEPQSVLDELNREFAKEFGCKVYRRKSDRKLVVTDLEGKEIMVNNG
jgi:hypothetical protein